MDEKEARNFDMRLSLPLSGQELDDDDPFWNSDAEMDGFKAMAAKTGGA